MFTIYREYDVLTRLSIMYSNGVSDRFHVNTISARKVFLIVFFISISGLLLLYHRIYPLYLTWDSGFLAQVPLAFWPVIVLVVSSGISYCALTSSKAKISVVMTIVFVTVNYTQFLFFNFTGGDSAGEISRWYSIRGLPRFSAESFSYFQWPLHFTFFEIYNKVLGLALIETMRVSYLSLYILFIISVFYFTFKYTPKNTYWIAASVYVVFMLMFLNNQLVPQLFALTVLIFLFGFEKENTRKSFYIQIFLYTLLVLSHPFFFVFYLMSISLFPFVRSFQSQLAESGDPSDRVYSSLVQALLKPYSTFKGLLWNGLRGFRNETLLRLTFMTAIYLFLLEFQFPDFQQKFYNEFTGSISPHGSGSLVARLPEILFSDASATSSGPETVLLYQLSSEMLHTVSIYVILAVLVSLLLLSLVRFLQIKTEDMSLIPISMAASGAIYYVGGFFLPIIGPRAYQIALLPMGVFIVGRHLDKKTIKIIVLIALVVSPVIGLNIMINASVAGGGNTQNHYAHSAGQHLAQYDTEDGENTVKYPHSGLPPEFTFQQNQRITTVEEIIIQEDTVRNPSVIVFGPRQVHVAAHYDRECNFEPSERNAIYDNKITVLADSTSSSGINCVRSGRTVSD